MKLLARLTTLILTLTVITTWAQNIEPMPVSGKTLTRNFVNRSLVYPEQDLAENKSGKVVIDFFIDKDGKTSDFAVNETFSEEASKTAIDMVKKIEWKPATHDGEPIATEYQYEIVFNAKSYKRGLKKRITVPLVHPTDTSLRVYENRSTDEWAHPYFKDGTNMTSYITNNLTYPNEAKQKEISGTVKLSFIVECDGNVSNIEVINSVGGGCDNEAIRLIENTLWIPAVKNGVYVRTRNKQDITFNIGSHNFIDGNKY